MKKEYYRGHLQEDVEMWQKELKDARIENDEDYIEECLEEIKKLDAQDEPFREIKISNEITLNTLKKIARNYHSGLERFSVMRQPLENLDNGFITPEALNYILNVVLREKSDGSFRKGVKNLFGSRGKVRFIKSKLVELNLKK